MAWVTVCAAGDLAPGEMKSFRAEGRDVAVYHLEDGFYATAAICTHEKAILTKGRLEGGRVACPLHGARFDVRTGRVVTPPAFKPLKTFAVRVEAGQVQVAVET